MTHTKYITSGGLAFAEEKDMEKLRNYSLKGWHVSEFKFMGYILKKGDSKEYIYSVDYRPLRKDEMQEYMEYFSFSGWEHISSEDNIHLFRALPGTKPIYSDRETTLEKHHNLGSSLKWPTISLLFLTVLLWLGTFISTGTLQITLAIIAFISTALFLPSIMTVITIYGNKWRAEGKGGLVKLIKYLPLLFFVLMTVFILLVVDGLSRSAVIIACMLIGGLISPAIIWGVMSLYYRIGKRA